MRSTTNGDGNDQVQTSLSIARLVVGAFSLGSDKLADQVRRVQREPVSSLETDGAMAAPSLESDGGPPSMGDLGAGIFTETMLAAGHLLSATAGGARRVAAGVSWVGDAPVLRPATRPLRRRYREGDAAIRDLAMRGRSERMAGRRMVGRLIRDATARSFTEAAQVALSQVTQSPEVADMVKTQTAGIATETILEVRSNSKRADDGVERRIHSWLGVRKSKA
jgi:hypothetical protein